MPDALTAALAADVLGCRHWWQYIIDHGADYDLDVWIAAMSSLEAVGC